MAEHRTSPWVAFAAGAVAMLAVALGWFAWQGRYAAAELTRAAVAAVHALPRLRRPLIPDTPRLPDNPVPRPK